VKFFQFYRREHSGVLIILGVSIVLALVPRVLSNQRVAEQITYTQDQKTIDALNAGVQRREDSIRQARFAKYNFKKSNKSELLAMGFSADAAEKILNHIQMGGNFNNLSELSAIAGIDSNSIVRYFKDEEDAQHPKNPFTASQPLEINGADSAALTLLPGIGPYTASKIIRYRNSLRGFIALRQLSEIRGIDTSSIQKLYPILTCDARKIILIQPNKETEESLRLHPYISSKQAKLLKSLCLQHGNAAESVFLKHPAFTAVEKQRLLPYIKF
jgi:hypothetical protein